MAAREWLVVPRPNPGADAQVLCLPNAGGGIAAFAGWVHRLPAAFELALVQLPGRDGRRQESSPRTIGDVADGLAAAIRSTPPRKRVFFGHSMGALIAFEAARRLAGSAHTPSLLVAAGRRAPSLPEWRTPISHLPADEFASVVGERYGGLPDVVLADPELRDLFLPILQADLASVEGYRYLDGPRLDCPIAAYAGMEDPHAPAGDSPRWRRETSSTFLSRAFPGGHFFVQSARDQVLAALIEDYHRADVG